MDKKRLWFAILNLTLLLLAAGLVCLFWQITTWLPALHAADRWQGSSEMDFSQIGCYLPADTPKSKEEILQFRRTLEQKLTENSLSAPEGGKLYADAWSAEAKLTVSGSHGKTEASVIGVGGDFFLFHPLELRSGSYLSEKDLMQDRVILDEVLAWTLFGSADVAGMTVYVDQMPLYVAGVISREDDFASRQAYRDNAGMFLSYDAFYALTEKKITCYEIVLPNVVSGFGLGLVEENFQVGTGCIVENSSRYGIRNIVEVAGDFGLRSMGHNGVIYPYWENAVRLTEDYLALLLVMIVLFAAFPLIVVLSAIIRGMAASGRYVRKKIPAAAEQMIEKRRETNYEQENRKRDSGVFLQQ